MGSMLCSDLNLSKRSMEAAHDIIPLGLVMGFWSFMRCLKALPLTARHGSDSA